ncbi:MAG TPA: substrate-binding domain-containing protein [Iamia sp.]|nr:substrate-binding domain-containing protein [Iamia sp.]
MRPLAIVVSALVLLGAGCGNDNSDKNALLTDARADTSVTGSVTVTGSSTVEPVSSRAGEAFRGQNAEVDVSVEGPGTGDGFERFCEGGADVTGASRPIKPEELERCSADGIEVIELAIGLDGVAVITSPDNPVECLTFADLYALIGVEAEGVGNWAEAEDLAGELGSTTTLPDERLVLTGPGEESGTYDAFIELVLKTAAEPRVEAGTITEEQAAMARVDYAASANDNTIVEGVAADTGGLGWVGLSYAEQADDVAIIPIALEPEGPCITPNRETVQDGSYPISRDLYIYVSAAAAERPEVAAFVDFYLAGLPDFLELADYIEQPDPKATVERWDARTTGPAEPAT